MTLTPTQVEARDRRAKFRHSIEQRAATLKSAPPVVEATPAPQVVFAASPCAYPAIDEIQRAVCKFFHVPKLQLCGAQRERPTVEARRMAMYLCRKLTPHSFQKIGRRFGDKDHSTVLSACRRVEHLLPLDADLAHNLAILLIQITGDAR